MIFQFTFKKVLSQEKTQTRRLVKPNQEYGGALPHNIPFVYDRMRGNRHIYEIGHTYAVQPGRGKAAVGRIEITRIWQEDVRDISNADVRAEGYNHVRDFLHVWNAMHDPAIERMGWGEKVLMSRPANRYMAWVLQFKLVEVK